jgi:hypothetical protein
MLTSSKFRRGLDALWLAALAVFILAGMPLATFHGDEAMQIYMSHDYATALIYGEPVRLLSDGPFDIDSDPHLRIINGSVNRYGIGLGWHLAGLTNGDLPPRPGWDWGLNYAQNVETGHRPADTLLMASRASSTIFLALSAVVMFAIGGQMGGRPVAYLASALYSLNPILLLNGRRAMMEGSMLFFGLLAILIALLISRKSRGWGWWLALAITSGLALASKHTAAVLVAGAFGWIGLTALIQRDWRALGKTVLKLALAGSLTIILFVGLSPALWYDPPARFQDLVRLRAELLDIQVQVNPDAPTSLIERISGIIATPFMQAPQHYEVASWGEAGPILQEIDRYMASPLSGWQFGPVLGALLTILAVVGLATLRGWRAGLWVWLGLTLALLVFNPLPWQRYYLPWIPLATLLASLGAAALIGRIVHRPVQDTYLPAATIPPKL